MSHESFSNDFILMQFQQHMQSQPHMARNSAACGIFLSIRTTVSFLNLNSNLHAEALVKHARLLHDTLFSIFSFLHQPFLKLFRPFLQARYSIKCENYATRGSNMPIIPRLPSSIFSYLMPGISNGEDSFPPLYHKPQNTTMYLTTIDR